MHEYSRVLINQQYATYHHIIAQCDEHIAVGKAFFDMLGVFAKFETSLHSKRQLDEVAKPKKVTLKVFQWSRLLGINQNSTPQWLDPHPPLLPNMQNPKIPDKKGDQTQN